MKEKKLTFDQCYYNFIRYSVIHWTLVYLSYGVLQRVVLTEGLIEYHQTGKRQHHHSLELGSEGVETLHAKGRYEAEAKAQGPSPRGAAVGHVP